MYFKTWVTKSSVPLGHKIPHSWQEKILLSTLLQQILKRYRTKTVEIWHVTRRQQYTGRDIQPQYVNGIPICNKL
jgi:hypothetical protein